MTITREQVADLQPGDVVEYRRDDWPEGCYVHSPLTRGHGVDSGLYVLDGYFGVRDPAGSPFEDMATLTVVSRAPRPLYVNHPRAEAVAGDVVGKAGADGSLTLCWIYDGHRREYGWHETSSDLYWGADQPWPRLRLLVDGETGQVVP